MRPTPRLAALLIPFFLAACRSAGIAECTETGECPADQVCNRHTRLCYKPNPEFSIEISRPAANERVGAVFQLTGTVANADGGVSSLEYQIGDGGWTSLTATASGNFEAYPPLPQADGDPVSVTVHATDGTGRETNNSVNVLVDNVGPVATLTAADGERTHPFNVAVQFSEPVLPADPSSDIPLLLEPSPQFGSGVWNQSRTEYRIANLDPDTRYTATVPANVVRDAANNVNQIVQLSFRTAPVQPPTGLIVPPPAPESFDRVEATSDQDGVVTLAAHASSAGRDQVIWGWFDPANGGFVSHAVDTSVGSVSGFSVGASVDDALDAPRMHALTVHLTLPDGGSGTQVFWSTDGGVQSQLIGALAVVPGRPGCGESGATDALGFAVDAGGTPKYQRSPAGLALNVVPAAVTYSSPSDWAFYAVADGGLVTQQLAYDCDTLQAPTAAAPRVLATNLSDFPSAASVPTNQVYAYTVNSSRRVTCSHCSNDAGTCELPAPSELRLASMHEGSNVLGAKRDANLGLALISADVSRSCPPTAADWSDGGVEVPGTTTVTEFQPVLFGHTPGMVYVDQGSLVVFKAPSP